MVASRTTRASTNDPYESAEHAEWDPTYTVYGEVQVDVWYCAFVKGDPEKGIKGGKEPFDPARHDIAKRATAIDLAILPIVPGRRPTERSLVAESQEWAKIINPSIKALGVSLRDLHGKFVEAQIVPTGRKYAGSEGVERDATTIKFTRLFASEDECRAAAEAHKPGQNGTAPATNGAAPATNGAAPAPAASTANAERATKAKFLPALWKQSGGDLDKFMALVRKTGLPFAVDSPEIMALVMPDDEAPF